MEDLNLNNIRGTHMDFEVIEVQENFLLMDASKSTLVDLGESLESFRSNKDAYLHLSSINDKLSQMVRVGKSSTGNKIDYKVIPFIADFRSDMVPDREGLKVTYTVEIRGDSLDKQDLLKIENVIYEVSEEVEAMMKTEFRQIQEITGKEAQII